MKGSLLKNLFHLLIAGVVGTIGMALSSTIYERGGSSTASMVESFGITFSVGAIVTIPLCLIFGSILVAWFRRKQWYSAKAYAMAAIVITIILALLLAWVVYLLAPHEELTLSGVVMLLGWCAAGSFPAVFTYYWLQKPKSAEILA